LFHHSPLAEFLLEKAIANTRVVGHAFFWCLKANLNNPSELACQERFFLIIERFLMTSGQFSNELFTQNLTNDAFI
jgi:phosphatidylinositol-4,5-bisphosphate 3-kinase/phosphatidylinositol-4-phosphate 3-kinase